MGRSRSAKSIPEAPAAGRGPGQIRFQLVHAEAVAETSDLALQLRRRSKLLRRMAGSDTWRNHPRRRRVGFGAERAKQIIDEHRHGRPPAAVYINLNAITCHAYRMDMR